MPSSRLHLSILMIGLVHVNLCTSTLSERVRALAMYVCPRFIITTSHFRCQTSRQHAGVMEALRIQSAMLRRSQMWHVTSFCRYTNVRRQSTFTSKTGKAPGSKLSSRSTLASPGLQALSAQLHPRIQARTLQTTT